MYLRVCFPSGCYYAAEAHDPCLPEWPPHPSRLFSALVASAYRSDSGITRLRRKALVWLESLPAPAIAAPIAERLRAPISYVPPGDMRRSKGKKRQKQYEHGVHRWRQPRHFPSASILGEPIVYYGWQEDPEVDLFAVLDEITAGVTHVGTSHSMAVVTSCPGEMPESPTLLPDSHGTDFLRVTAPGRLQELDAVFEQTTGVRRPTPACEPLAAYRSIKDLSIQEQASEFLTLRIVGSMHGADTSAYLGRAVRRAVMSVLGDNAPPPVHGHNGGRHVGWLPLPDVGHPYAKGKVVGVGIMLPQGLDWKQRKEVLSGVNRIQELRLPDGRITQLVPTIPGERLPVALLRWTWTRSSINWATATPVVLDRPPKRLTEERVCNALSQSLVFAGYPEPRDVKVSSFSVFKGAPPAFRVPAEKPRYHAIVRFHEPVKGPVIAGRLRYFGVGLFRPFSSFNAAGGPK